MPGVSARVHASDPVSAAAQVEKVEPRKRTGLQGKSCVV